MLDHAAEMRATVRQNTGIPTCGGIGPTKTMAKFANNCTERTEVWGVGSRTTDKLRGIGINTVAQLRDMPMPLARQIGTVVVVLERMVAELRGIPCIEIRTWSRSGRAWRRLDYRGDCVMSVAKANGKWASSRGRYSLRANHS
jgi:nucleotidyltransferase/DNA polymerase involved in DNA repair